MKSTLLLLLLTLLCGTKASAQTFTTIAMEQVVEVQSFKNAYYKLTPDQTGLLKLVCVDGVAANSYAVTTTGKTATDGSVETAWSYADNGCLSFSVTAGTTYYISLVFPMQDWKFKATMGEDFKLLNVEPADGEKFYITSNNNAVFQFSSSSVTFTEGEISANGNIIKVYNFEDYNELVRKGIFTYTEIGGSSGVVNWNGHICGHYQEGLIIDFSTRTGYGSYNVINKLVEDGKLNAGDKITLTLHGIKDNLSGNLLNGDGNIEVNWTFAGAPTTLVSYQMPEVINSWFNTGDPEGVATYTFSKEIKSARAFLEMGDGSAQDFYSEELPADKIIFDGRTVRLDLCGVMRTKKTMGLSYNWNNFNVKLADVIDIDGKATFSEDQGSSSSYTFAVPYRDITSEVASEFTPASGKALTADTKNIEIWFNNSKLITWDGVVFIYYTEEGGETVSHEVFVPKADLKVEEIDEETVINVAVPEGIYQYSNVRVAVNVTGSKDGTEHVIAAYYNTTLSHDLNLAMYAFPESGSTLSYLQEIYFQIGMVHAINPNIAVPVLITGQNTGYRGLGEIVSDGMMSVKLLTDALITKADTYTFTIAPGVVGDYVYGESGFKAGTTHEQCTLTYTVDGKYDGKAILVDPAEGEVESLQNFSLQFIEYAAVAPSWDSSCKPYIKNPDGTTMEFDFDVQPYGATNILTISLPEAITAKGDYTLVLPAGSVADGASGDPLQEEFTFSYTVTATTAITSVGDTKAKTNAIHNINGQRVSNITPGLYIINGKKVVK